jgi:hypothetical protein
LRKLHAKCRQELVNLLKNELDVVPSMAPSCKLAFLDNLQPNAGGDSATKTLQESKANQVGSRRTFHQASVTPIVFGTIVALAAGPGQGMAIFPSKTGVRETSACGVGVNGACGGFAAACLASAAAI